MDELFKALQSMEGGKAPGLDGLSVEFYKAFWDELSNDFLMVLNESFNANLLPISCRRAVITLLTQKKET